MDKIMLDLTTVIAIIGALFAANAWVVNKLDKIAAEIATLRAEARDFVTHETCHRRRQECPCIAAVENLEKKLSKLD